MSETLSLKDVVAMGLGGTIGGGIFAALGVAIAVAGNGAILTFAIAGVVALISGYSYVQLTDNLNEDGGSYTFIEYYITNPDLAGFSGWVLILGYIGTMALYAYAFGSFLNSVVAAALSIPPLHWMHIMFSLLIIGMLLVLNLQGAGTSGTAEVLMVGFKITVLVVFGAIGVLGVMFRPELTFVPGGAFNNGFLESIIAVPLIFVSYEGFELLSYEYSVMEDGIETLRKGVFITIIGATLIYILIVVAVTGVLSPLDITTHEETVLAVLGAKLSTNAVFNDFAFGLIIFTALLSTTSAINATMFSTARLISRISRKKQLPDMYSRFNRKEVPVNSLLLLTILTSALVIVGTLTQITIFASFSFIVLFTIVNYIAYKDKKTNTNQGLLMFGIISSLSILLLFIFYLYEHDPFVILIIVLIYIAIAILELFFIERKHRLQQRSV